MVRRFWRSETFQIWVQYFAAGIAMIPAGITYFALIDRFGERKGFDLALALAVVVGLIVWMCVGYFLRSQATRPSEKLPSAAVSNEADQNLFADKTWLSVSSDVFELGAGQSQAVSARATLIAGLR
jgi:hypothetical protein